MDLLLQSMKFPIGYVRFMAAMAISATRKALDHSAVPGAAVGWAVLACFVTEVIEDVIVLLLAHLGLHATFVFETLAWEQALQRAKRRRARSCWWPFVMGSSAGPAPRGPGSESIAASREVHVLPGSASPPGSTEDEMGEKGLEDERLLARLLVDSHRFSTEVLLSDSSTALPGWAHFSVVYAGMFVMVLTMIFVLGLDFSLGFTDAIAIGAGARAFLWWPLDVPEL